MLLVSINRKVSENWFELLRYNFYDAGLQSFEDLHSVDTHDNFSKAKKRKSK